MKNKMKKLLLLISAVLLVSCSQNKPKYTINGTLPSKQYDGEFVYLVPAIGDSPSNVDSTFIKDGKFVFTGDTERVSIIRVRPVLRLKLQELLVVTEKGNITVALDTNSIGGGTLQNKLLQQWKTSIFKSTQSFVELQNAKKKSIKGKVLEHLMVEADSSKKATDDLTLNIIHHHRGSTLSNFLSHLTGMK